MDATSSSSALEGNIEDKSNTCKQTIHGKDEVLSGESVKWKDILRNNRSTAKVRKYFGKAIEEMRKSSIGILKLQRNKATSLKSIREHQDGSGYSNGVHKDISQDPRHSNNVAGDNINVNNKRQVQYTAHVRKRSTNKNNKSNTCGDDRSRSSSKNNDVDNASINNKSYKTNQNNDKGSHKNNGNDDSNNTRNIEDNTSNIDEVNTCQIISTCSNNQGGDNDNNIVNNESVKYRDKINNNRVKINSNISHNNVNSARSNNDNNSVDIHFDDTKASMIDTTTTSASSHKHKSILRNHNNNVNTSNNNCLNVNNTCNNNYIVEDNTNNNKKIVYNYNDFRNNKYYNKYHKKYIESNSRKTITANMIFITDNNSPITNNNKNSTVNSTKNIPIVRDIAFNNKYYNPYHYKYGDVSDDNKFYEGRMRKMLNCNVETIAMGLRAMSGAYKSIAVNAYKNRRIFIIHGNFPVLREALLDRGWVEKLPADRHGKLQNLSDNILLQKARRGNVYEAVLISKIMKNFPAFFIWQYRNLSDLNTNFGLLPHNNLVSRSRGTDFSTKVGLIGCAEIQKWYQMEGVSEMTYPRFYRLHFSIEEREEFIEDNRRTQCRSLIRLIVENYDQLSLFTDMVDGTVDSSIIEFALEALEQELKEADDESLKEITLNENSSQNIVHTKPLHEWKDFMQKSDLILWRKSKFQALPSEIAQYVKTGHKYLKKLDELHSDYKWDGCRNLWIMKPGFKNCGIGIYVKSSLDDMLLFSMHNQTSKYIAQKYIERPLLVYKTKFDIRQYMLLVIGKDTISIWLYKDCYLRFSSQNYNINDLRESIHLTNNTVQKRYRNSYERDSRLPHNNMWSLEQFLSFLKSSNAPENVWENKIFAGFRQNIIAVILASSEETNFVENSFELYGCDFMLDEQYNPILIEINSTPDLSPSTDVTARICPMTMDDLVKVIVDVPRYPNALTGLFEKVFDIRYKEKQDFDPQVGLPVTGKSATLHDPAVKPVNPPTPLKKSKSCKIVDPVLEPPTTPSKEAIHPIEAVMSAQPVQPRLDRPIKKFYLKRFLRKLVAKLF